MKWIGYSAPRWPRNQETTWSYRAGVACQVLCKGLQLAHSNGIVVEICWATRATFPQRTPWSSKSEIPGDMLWKRDCPQNCFTKFGFGIPRWPRNCRMSCQLHSQGRLLICKRPCMVVILAVWIRMLLLLVFQSSVHSNMSLPVLSCGEE